MLGIKLEASDTVSRYSATELHSRTLYGFQWDCVHAVCIHTDTCVYMLWRPELMLGAFFYCSPPCFLRQDLLLNLELPMSVKLVAQQDPGRH